MAAKKPKIGLALGGGATYGYAHIGVLKALSENDITIDCIAGTSAGALVGACHAFGMTTDQIVTASKELTWRKIADISFSSLGLITNKSLAAYVMSVIGDVRIEDAPIPLAIVATNIETRQKVVFQKGNLGLALRASACVPGVFKPVEVHGSMFVDGGLLENVPVRTLKTLGPDIMIGVNLQAHMPAYRPRSIFDVLAISMSMLTEHRDAHLASHADILIEPDLAPFNLTSFQNAEAMIQAGYNATMAQMPAIKTKIKEQTKNAGFWGRLLALNGS